MQWIKISKEQPPYYTPVLIEVKSGTHIVAWRAVNDDGKDIYTINLTDDILFDNEMIYRWSLINKK